MSRRRLLHAAWALPGAWALSGCAVSRNSASPPPLGPAQREGQRRADRGDGRFLNPIFPGDHPDPAVVKDGHDYYMTFSSFEAVPGLVIWHSRDLVNWQPIGAALTQYIGSVWAPDLVKHADRWYLYVPAKHPNGNDIWVLTARDIRGPWSTPVALGIDRIDPGHAVDEQGRRWLFLNAGLRVPLSADGLKRVGPEEHVYGGWPYPETWDVESFSQEGPTLCRHGGWWYMTLAQGGTAGPPTGHMVISARARTLAGPWEHSPYNPIVRTRSAAEAWWSRGHATLIEGPTPGDWYATYHGYENGYRTLGRQTLLDPIEWTADGWWRARGGDLSQPLPMPRGGAPVPHGMALSDDFAGPALGLQWSFHRGDRGDIARARVGGGVLDLACKGRGPADSSPLLFNPRDRAYEVEVDIDFDEGAQAGLLLFYSERLYAGLGVDRRGYWLHRYGEDRRRDAPPAGAPRRLQIRLRLREHVLTLHTRHAGAANWVKYGTQMEVSGYHHNVAGGFMSLRPAIYAAGEGRVRFRQVRYRALAAEGPAAS